MAYHSMTVCRSFKNNSPLDLVEFFVSDPDSAISLQKQLSGGVLINFTNFTGKHLCQNPFLIKVQALGLQLY